MERVLEEKLKGVIEQVEQQVDEEIQKLEKLDIDDIEKIRERRLAEMKKAAKQKNEWLAMGHGEYSELGDEKEFFDVSKKSPRVVCHFYKDGSECCKILDNHMKILAPKHPETRFCKLNVERCPFLVGRLNIKIMPTIALVVEQVTKDYIRGFTELGNREDFKTDMLEWRIAQCGAINYSGDLNVPPEQDPRKSSLAFATKKTIRDDGSDDDDLSD